MAIQPRLLHAANVRAHWTAHARRRKSAPHHEDTEKKRPPQGRPFQIKADSKAGLVTVDDDGLAVVIDIPVAVASLDHDGVVTIPVITLADNVAIAIAITITMSGSDGHADRPNTDANFFRTSGDRKRYCSHGYRSHYKTLDHRMFLSL